MAVDLEQARKDIGDFLVKAHEVEAILVTALAGKVAVKTIGDITFTSAQKQALLDAYTSAKGEAEAIWTLLPA